VTSTGKPARHVITRAECDTCHSTRAWKPANFNHDQIAGRCDSCHNGSMSTGKPASHVMTTSDCGACHTTNAWKPANFSHDNAGGLCGNCHNGVSATGKPGNHFISAKQCDECHTVNAWRSVNYRHSSSNYPGDHNSTIVCKSCHTGNTEAANWTSAAYKPACAGCHASRYRIGSHLKTGQPEDAFYPLVELKDCTGACHVYTNNTFSVIQQPRTGHHRSNAGGW
jgi:hypothetical protein